MPVVSGSTKAPPGERAEDRPRAPSHAPLEGTPLGFDGGSDFDALAALAAAMGPIEPEPSPPPASAKPGQDTRAALQPASLAAPPAAGATGPHVYGNAWGRLIDGLAGDVLLTHVPGRRVLDLGHGSPEIAEWVAARVEHLSIVEKAALEQPGRIAEASGFLPASEVIDAQGNLKIDDSGPPLRLHEYADGIFEVVYCMRTYPHLGFDAASSDRLSAQLLREAARVTADGGSVFVQIANPRSLRGVVEGIRHPITAVSRRRMIVGDRYGLTRWDTLRRFRRFLPPELEFVRVHGLGVTIPHDATLQIPLLGRLLGRLEWWLRDMGVVRRFGALLLVELRRIHRPR
jgi:SAM-dependent methyltransferase